MCPKHALWRAVRLCLAALVFCSPANEFHRRNVVNLAFSFIRAVILTFKAQVAVTATLALNQIADD